MSVVHAVRRDVTVGPEVRARVEALLPEAGYGRAAGIIKNWPGYAETPLVSCPDIAERVGVGELHVKDESGRLGLKSFKSLGGAYAVHQAYERWQEAQGPNASSEDFVVTCVTDGNHGLSVAWGARQLGCRCIIYLPDVVTERREKLIRDLGAEVVRRQGNYDQVTVQNAADAEANGWTIVTDTSSTEVNHQTVADVMQGYRVLAQELVQQYGDQPPTHVFLQAGCGGMAAALIGHLVTRWGPERLPRFVIVEPERAACLLETARADAPQVVEGDLETMMAGLSVGEISLVAWEILKDTVANFVAIPDDHVQPAMRALGKPEGDRPVVVSGETGAAGVAALLSVAGHEDLRAALQLDPSSTVLVVSTEGDTDPELYAELVNA